VSSGALKSRSLMTLRLSTAPTQNIGAGPRGARITFPITGASFRGRPAARQGEIRADGPVHLIEEIL